ncbi:NAD(P)/FAD-dependent oxidoreductase [Flavihumibacter sp. CACIAM 22H1]|uniref:phytoene desaturase family protein n=1 Tax=Flavihumibacter sp. CACIAM 22H1 TaxID=1812911 RepID=UPI0007A916CD|nr:NAD(P)/FAD-dependent oxidoreductase [Flavihumibacter sp. CACIAM 22H1]KYP15323.1 MAG: FAD-dependent oxidoreductase [Flavihumibacter sp. CACIAM 22H1]
MEYDVIVVGAGPNGLAAGITLQQQGLKVLLLEAKATIGGGMRTAALTLPGFKHDICSAIHPMAKASPFFASINWSAYGLAFIDPPVCAAHPLDTGSCALLLPSLEETAEKMGIDRGLYHSLLEPLVKNFGTLTKDILGPLSWPSNPVLLAGFGLKALQPASRIAGRFASQEAKALFGGMAAHGIQPLSNWASAAIGLVLLAAGHSGGWPIPIGGSQSIADAMAAHFQLLGGVIETNTAITSLQQLPRSKAVVFDCGPRQLIEIAGEKFSSFYQWQLKRYRYGMGVFKIDWALDAPIPWRNEDGKRAGTLHIGNSFEEISWNEAATAKGKLVDNPFVLLAQPSLFDSTRAPAGKHTAWAYCHVPFGAEEDRTAAIEAQVERFAPGFKERIIGRHTMNTRQMQEYNPNYIGGDINGGLQDLGQLFTRPALRWSPYKTSAKELYICSSSTPPGGGVHGMCGYHAARRILKDLF